MFRGDAVPGFDYRDTALHKRMLAEAYEGAGWRVPELLERVREADDLYFDAVSRVRMDSWNTGRIVLAGDAASSVSLFGDGSTLAMAGAYTLADGAGADSGRRGLGVPAVRGRRTESWWNPSSATYPRRRPC